MTKKQLKKNAINEQVPRTALIGLLLAQLSIILPHMTRLPLWLLAVYILCISIRVLVLQGRLSFPGKLIKLPLTLFTGISLLLSYLNHIGLELMVAMLIAACMLKLLEMHYKKDAFQVICLNYFLAVTEFLFSQSIPMSIYILICVIINSSALIYLHQQIPKPIIRNIKLASIMLLQSTPLMLIFFIVFPRISPLWTVPLSSQSAVTGIGDSITPGDIAELGQSDEIAFRASFIGAMPAHRNLYWRGLVFSDFDGKTWRPNKFNHNLPVSWYGDPASWEQHLPLGGTHIEYSVILERTDQAWLFSLDFPQAKTAQTGLTIDMSLVPRNPVSHRIQYEVSSYIDMPLLIDPAGRRYQQDLKLPKFLNPKTRKLAKKLSSQANTQREYIDLAMNYFVDDFRYTLRPPKLLTQHTIDEFLFNTQRGFCSHFAGSFVYLLRLAGIPARVVAGYLGGEVHPSGTYVAIHQFDAHAWTEAWLEDQGWVRFDPTAIVAPERVEHGLEAAVAAEESFLADSFLSPLRYKHIQWLTKIRLNWDELNFQWHRLVLGYQSKAQKELLQQWFGEMNFKKIIMILMITCTIPLVVLTVILLRKRNYQNLKPETQLYLQFCQLCKNAGYERALNEAADNFCKRLIDIKPGKEDQINHITNLYQTLAYKKINSQQRHQLNNQLKKSVRRFSMKT